MIFLTLKLCGVVAWSWWWVTAPLWGTSVVAVVFMVIGVLVAASIDRRDMRARARV